MSNEKWHLSKSVNLSHILVTLTIFLGGFMYVSSLEYLDRLLSGKYSKKVKDQYNEYKRIIT